MLLVLGSDGTGDGGYKNDMTMLRHFEQTDAEIQQIQQWVRSAQEEEARQAFSWPRAYKNPWWWPLKKYFLNNVKAKNCLLGEAPCQKSFDPDHPLPWNADRTYRSWTVNTGPLKPYWGIGNRISTAMVPSAVSGFPLPCYRHACGCGRDDGHLEGSDLHF